MAPKNGVVSLPWSIDLKVQFVATADIGEVAARAFDEPNEFISQEIELSGDELDGHRIIELLSKILNQPLRFKQAPPKAVLKLFAKDFYAMVLFFETKGYHADITALKKNSQNYVLLTIGLKKMAGIKNNSLYHVNVLFYRRDKKLKSVLNKANSFSIWKPKHFDTLILGCGLRLIVWDIQAGVWFKDT